MTLSSRHSENDRSNPRLSRSGMRRRLQRRSRKIRKQKQLIDRLHEHNRALSGRLRQAIEQRQLTEQQLIQQQASQAITMADSLQSDRPLPGHQFGVKLIAANGRNVDGNTKSRMSRSTSRQQRTGNTRRCSNNGDESILALMVK